jgi:glyoxylase-like metal-dependent hydrolase (beta-lactamase superfamily II)/rhodanese-related sulfurtransferase
VSADTVIPVVDEGLGNSSYLVDLGDGRALAVDPPRDLRGLRAAAVRRGLRVAFAADTHLHADFLSGARQLAASDGARILASAAGDRQFDHTGLDDGDEVDLGGLSCCALGTPGHTHEHLSFLVLDGATPVGVFTGGSLIVGSAARTDLLGADQAEPLARAQYRSLRQLATLPDATAVWPTHGSGSFCSGPPGAQRTSTIGEEKASNPLLAVPDEDTFVERLIAGLGSYPVYFDQLAELNRRGPAVVEHEPVLDPLDGGTVRRLLGDGAALLDVRPVADFAFSHVPGAISIALRAQYATWLGWLLPPDQPLVIVRNPDQDPADILWPALNIGYEQISGELAGGVLAWAAAGGRLRRIPLVRPGNVEPSEVLDVRQDSEYRDGHLPGSSHVELGDLPAHSADILGGRTTVVTARRTVVMCAHGERAMTGASLLERAGHPRLAVLRGGPDEWAEAAGRALTDGE